MTGHAFSRPFTMLVGLGFPRHIAGVGDALACLEEMPALRQDEAYDAIREICMDVLAGVMAADEARDLFCAFARRHGLLVEESASSPHGAAARPDRRVTS